MRDLKLNKQQKGLTLVELMVAMVLSLVLIGGVSQTYLSSKQTYRLTEAQSRIQENGRFALYLLTRDIRMADFWGCASTSDAAVSNNLDTTHADYDSTAHDFSNGVFGLNGAIDAINSGLDAPDEMTIQGAFDRGIIVQPPFGPQASSNIKISTGNGLAQGDIILVADCLAGDIFQISNSNPDTGGVAGHNTGSATSPGNYNPSTCGGGGSAHCLSKVYAADASIYKLGVKRFFIEASTASGEPSLKLWTPEKGKEELVEGVQNMQILYGVDTDGDYTPNYYVHAGNVADMEQVVSVKISLLLHSMENNVTSNNLTVNYNGGTSTIANRRLGRVFSATITIRNRMQ